VVRSKGELRSELGELASPKAVVNAQGKLDAGPNRIIDRPFPDEDLANLPSIQRTAIDVLLHSLLPNTPPIVRHSLSAYDRHLAERNTQPIKQVLHQFSSAIEKEFHASGDMWGEGLADLFESFFQHHALLDTHFPLKNEELFADTPIDEDQATGAELVEPAKAVAEAVADAVDADLATEQLAQVVQSNAQYARDIAPLPPDEIGRNPKSRRVSIKRRYVLGTIGFFVTLYGIIGSTASIVSTPQGAALLRIVGEAIDRLMKLVL
jgi:hypothetical protein